MSDLPRSQHMIASTVVAVVGIWVAYISYTQEPADAFIYPRLISSLFVVLALWTMIKAYVKKSRVGHGISFAAFKAMLPGLILMLIYVFWAAKSLGFYTATTIIVFSLLSFYDSGDHKKWQAWIKRALITACFVAVMYGLFALLLKVYTPREILF